MSKLGILVLLVAALVAVASANKFRGRHPIHHNHGFHDDGFESDFGDDSEIDIGLHHNRHGNEWGGNHGDWGHQHHHPRRPIHWRGGKGSFGGRGGSFRNGGGLGHRRRHFPRHGIVAGGLRGSEGSFGGINRHNHLGRETDIGGHESSFLGGQNKFDIDHTDSDIHENDGIRKHNVINQEKIFAKDKTSGVNDVDAIHNFNGHSDSNHLGTSQTGIAGQEAGGHINNKLDVDRDFTAAGGHGSEIEAGGVGAI